MKFRRYILKKALDLIVISIEIVTLIKGKSTLTVEVFIKLNTPGTNNWIIRGFHHYCKNKFSPEWFVDTSKNS